jgi:hypothetical protein
MKTKYTVKKLTIFPAPAGTSLTKLSMAGNNLIISLVSDIPLGDGKPLTFFYTIDKLGTSLFDNSHFQPSIEVNVFLLSVSKNQN